MAMVLMLTTASFAKKVHTLGDSTMAPYDESATVTRGWGMYFGNFLTNGWTSINYAKGGRDSRGGYNELWQTAQKNVEAGDYVIIQFAHNDEKISGMDRDEVYDYYISKGMTTEAAALDTRGTTPSTTYKMWLGKIVDEVLAKGAHPVLVGAACRSYFSGSKIRRNGRHDLGDSFSKLTADGILEKQSVPADDHLMDYTWHMEQLAKEKGVPFVTLTAATAELYESYGDAKCHEQLFDGEGSTHFNTTGALLVARLCAQLMKEQGILSDNIVVPVDLSVSPMTADMGEAYKGQTLTKELTINGFGLSPSEGTITVSATEGIEISVDKKQWASTAQIDYKNGTLVQNIYARIVLTTVGAFSGMITVSSGDKQIEIPVQALTKDGSAMDNEPVTISFPFHDGKEGQTAVFGPDEKMGAFFKTSYVELGSSLAYKGVGSVGQQTMIQPAQQDGSANEGNAVNFYFIPKKGMIFTPTKISFNMTRYGTDGGKVDASWVASDGTVTSIATGLIPNRNNKTPNLTEVSETVSGANGSDGLCGLRLNLYSLGNTKQVGFGDIVIEGTLLGSPQDTRQYRLSVSLDNEQAGSLTITPNSDVFDEGDEVTVSVSENFGYHFTSWVNADGNIVSTANPYQFNITSDTVLKAMFSKAKTYSLNLTLTDGAQPNLVQIVPEGTMIDGKRMYEEGTEVKLTALNNRILTFTNWEDNSTTVERDVKMDSDKNLTATFSAADYIVGWDFYQDAPKSDRAADYAADSENAGMLSLRNAAGSTTSWLANGVAAGKVQGRYGIRVWRPIADNWYFELSFSSKGYQNLRLSAAVGDDYNAYSIINAEYSLNGTTFTPFGTYELPNRGWTDGEFDLPAEANDQQRVYIRFMPDYTSPKVGVESNNDGTMLTDVFVLAEATGTADALPVLVSSNPAQNATGVSASGSVILTFDNKIKAAGGAATLAGEEIAPVISGKTAIFKYSGLKYATQYTFSMPEGVLTSRSGKPVAATEITFTTMERQQPEPRLYDAVVANDGTGDYTTLQAAIDAAPEGRAKPWLIFVKNGRYKEHIDIPAKKPYLHIIGQDRDKTVILDDKLCGGDNAVHVSVGATVVVNASNIFFENITLENSYGHEKQAGPQALALNTIGDRIALNNVALLSYQDTWITTSNQKNRHYIKNSLIEGAVDFIYNGGDVYLDGDTIEINRPSGGYIVAPWHTADTKWGYVFQNNIIRAHKGVNVTDVWLGRPWHGTPKTVFINTQTFVNIPAKGWYNTMGGLPALWAEYNTVDANGNPLDLSQRETYYYYWIDKDAGTKAEVFNVQNTLTAEEAAQYTLKNVMGGSDGWQPDLLCEACDAPEVKGEGSKLSWNAVPYAICYVVTKNGEVVGFTTGTTFDGYTAGDVWQVQAVNENGGLSRKASVCEATAIQAITNGSHSSQSAVVQRFDLSGRQLAGHSLSASHPHIGLVRLADGTVHKVVIK